MKPLKTAATTIGLYTPIALFPLLYAAAAAAGSPAESWGHRGGHWQSSGWVEGLGTGTITAEVQPGTNTPCDSANQCQITISGSGATQPFFGGGGDQGHWGGGYGLGNFTLQAVLTVDLPDGTTNGFGGECYPVTGSLSLSPTWGTGTLVVDIQGQDCAVGSSTTLSAITATYVVDGSQSTGNFSGYSGVGTIGASVDASQSPPPVEFAFSGSLQGTGNSGDGVARRSSP
jgi:hypothetical protein